MLAEALLLLASIPLQETPVPGACTDPASQNIGKPGCFLSAEIDLSKAPPELYWHIVPAESEHVARSGMEGRRWSTVVQAHGRWWLYVLSPDPIEPALPPHHVAGPLKTAPGKQIAARFMESWFTPGMRTRVHSHSGPETFYVIDGEQCTETPTDRQVIEAGDSYTVQSGAHLQASAKGRRSMVLILAARDEPWMRLNSDWTASGFCR